MATPSHRLHHSLNLRGGASLEILSSDELTSAVAKLRNLTETSIGPSGFIKAVINSGGHMTVTSSSSRLFSALTITKPVHKLIIGSVRSHLSRFLDGGLFTALLTSQLITSSLACTLSRNFIINIYECLLEFAVAYMNRNECNGRLALNQSHVNIHVLISIVRSIIETKPVCSLDSDGLNHICRTVVGAFLNSIPEQPGSKFSPKNVSIISIEDRAAEKSLAIDGVLVRIYDLTPIQELLDREFRNTSSFKIAVVTTSLAGDDKDDISDVRYETSDDVDIDGVKYGRLLRFCERLVEMNVDVLMCQKVIHADLLHTLSRRGVLAVERLGKDTCDTVLHLTGCTGIGCLSTAIPASHVGTVNRLSHLSLCDRDYLRLEVTGAPLVTLVICGRSDEMLNELKTVCTCALHSLYDFMSHHTLLCGGGCWLLDLSYHLLSQVRSGESRLTAEYGCTKRELHDAARAFISSLHIVIHALAPHHRQMYSDRNYTHVWRVATGQSEREKRCSCGMRTWHVGDLRTLDSMFEEVVVARNRGDPGLVPTDAEDTGLVATGTKDTGRSISGEDTGIALCARDTRVSMNARDTGLSISAEEFVEACCQREVVVDGYTCAMNALTTAVTTAMSTLSIRQFIYDNS